MLLAAELFTTLVSFILPIGLAAYFCWTLKDGWKWLLYGVLAYIVLGVMVKLSLLTFLNSFDAFAGFSAGNLYGYAFFTAALDTLLMVGGSWMIIKVCSHHWTSEIDILDYATGMAGMASLLLVGVSCVQLMLFHVGTASALTIVLAGIERLCVLLIQMGWCLWIFKAVQDHRPIFVLYAFLVQFGLSLIPVLMNSVWQMPVVASTFLLLFAAAGMCLPIRSAWIHEQARRKEEKNAALKRADRLNDPDQPSLLSMKKNKTAAPAKSAPSSDSPAGSSITGRTGQNHPADKSTDHHD